MSWQRINSITYIDDTLITSAEYQLFIDEMQEDGQYFRPDHWISDQFPDGQGREAILGVRFSDALAFCKWLTERETGDWRYRLPTTAEAEKYLLTPGSNRSPLGYWVTESDNQARFAWIGNVATDPRGINDDLISVLNLALSSAADLAHRLTFDLNSTYGLADLVKSYGRADVSELDSALNNVCQLDRALHNALDSALPYERALRTTKNLSNLRELNHSLKRSLELAMVRSQTLDHARHIVPIVKLEPALAHVLDPVTANELCHSLAHSRIYARILIVAHQCAPEFHFDHALKPVISRRHDPDITKTLDSILNRELDNALKRELDSALNRGSDFDLDSPLKLYVDLFTLQERIAGRSPVFEGIRLVKERK
jgi:hypothetical protein